VIKFDAPIEKLFAKLEVTGADGANQAIGAPQVSDDGIRLSVKVPLLKPGDYQVKWAVVCIDTHHTQARTRLRSQRRIVIPQPIFAWPLVGAQVLIFGTTAFALFAAPRAVVTGDVSARSLVVLWRVLALIVLVMSPLRLWSIGAGMADSTFREVLPSMPQIMRETFAGRVWTWRLATALLLALVAWIPTPGRLATALMFVISAALLALQSVTSHAVDKGAFAITIHSCIRRRRGCGLARWSRC